MVKYLDHKKRQDDIFNLVVQTYINEGTPVSSEYLKSRYNLPLSSATLRHVMAELEDLGYLVHVHISSGRVPTQKGFRYYVDFLMREEADLTSLQEYSFERNISYMNELDDLLEEASLMISKLTHYAGVGLIHKERERLFLKGTRFIMREPEFEDIEVLRNIFTAFEEKMDLLGEFIEGNLTEGIKIFIGDEIEVEEIHSCSLIFSPLKYTDDVKVSLGVLGPVRMNYPLAVSGLKVVKGYLEEAFQGGV